VTWLRADFVSGRPSSSCCRTGGAGRGTRRVP
jgi:hypothetical protein